MEIRRATPHPALRGIVQSFRERRGSLGSRVVAWPLTARPQQIIDIYLGDPFRVRLDGGGLRTTPQAVVVGPQGSRRIEIHVSGEVHIFNILLQPAALNRLIGIDMASLVNEGIAARDVLGRHAVDLEDAARSAPDFVARVAAVERWFGRLLASSGPGDAIDSAARHLMTMRGGVRIESLVERSGLSARQFQRRFIRQVGLPPKLYARTIRFDSALTARRKDPTRSWTDIIHEAGYFDQAHFVHECRALVSAVPSEFTGNWDNIFPLHG